MINFSLSFPRMQGYKVFGLRCANALIEFSQCFFQGLWIKDHAYRQLTCFNEANISKFTKGKKSLPSLLSLVKMNEKDRASLAFVAEEDKPTFLKEIALLPNITVNHNAYVEDESEIMVGDIITLKVTLKRENFNVKYKEYARSNKYPCLKKEKWYIFIADPDLNIVIFQKAV